MTSIADAITNFPAAQAAPETLSRERFLWYESLMHRIQAFTLLAALLNPEPLTMIVFSFIIQNQRGIAP
jgi:hypothetical protein